MIEALWIDNTGQRTPIMRDGTTYTHNGKPLPNGRYAFDRSTERHVLYGPCETLSEAIGLMR